MDDHVEMARLLSDQLADAGYSVEIADAGAAALTRARARLPDLVITDLRMEGTDGLDVLEGVRALDPGIPVIIMTAFGAIESAVEAIKRGAYHYLTKPFQLGEVLLYVERALGDRQLRDEHRALRRLASEREGLGTLVGRSAPMRALYELIERVAPTPVPVLVRGESGSGKELVARALHFLGPRRDRPFVAVNCTALPESLLESELFGHVRGAFSGATSARRGLFVEADGGTLFLDEIGDMPAGLQAKLLRVIEGDEIRPVGADAPRRTDVRIVAATHQDLELRVREGAFRADLFYRLNVVPIRVPPLRERAEDVPLLIEHFLRAARERSPGCRAGRFSPELVARLAASPWPGNVRELENVVTRLVIVAPQEEVGVEDLRRHAPSVAASGAASGASAAASPGAPEGNPLSEAKQRLVPLRHLENQYISWVVNQCGGNKTRAAEILKIDVSTIHRREL